MLSVGKPHFSTLLSRVGNQEFLLASTKTSCSSQESNPLRTLIFSFIFDQNRLLAHLLAGWAPGLLDSWLAGPERALALLQLHGAPGPQS